MILARLIRGLFLLLCFLLPTAPAMAAGEDPTALLRELEATAAQVRNLSSSFTQEKQLALFARPVIFHGTLHLARPDRLRWEFTRPVPSVLIFKGESGLRCAEGQTTRFDLKSDPIMAMVAHQLWLWLGGDYAKLAAEYQLTLAAPHTLLVEPKNRQVGEFVASVTISFDPDSLQPRQVIIAEPGGDSTTISFHDYQLDTPLDENLFSRCNSRE
ncbi:MAG: LolA family protein [Desulfurivibrio sp.]